MVHLIYGGPGCGKSSLVAERIKSCLKEGKKVILLVPERYTVSAEKSVYRICDDTGKMNLEVLSFKRLCNRVAREYGGLCYNYAGKGCRILMMYRALSGIKENLHSYGKLELSDKKSIETVLDSIVMFKRAALTPEMLTEAEQREELKENIRLRRKLSDLSAIYKEYDRLLKEKYDDPEEDLERLVKILKEKDFFADKEVFIDSTSAFSGKELQVLQCIIEKSRSVTVTVGMLPDDSRMMKEKIRWYLSSVIKTAESAGVSVERSAVLDKPLSKTAPELLHLEKELFGEEQAYEAEATGIRLNRYSDPYAEAQAIAARILKNIQTEQGRFYKHTVIVRNIEDYKGIIDSVFEANGIPYVMAGSIPFSGRIAGRMILTVLRMYRYNIRREDLFAYMKTGLSGLEDGECFLLEEYANLWHIEGARWLSEKDFAMNPDGHTNERTAESIDRLSKINCAKEKLMAPVRALFEDLNASETAEDYATAIFEFLTSVKTEKKLSEAAEKSERAGAGREAQHYKQTFPLLCEMLDQLVYAMGDEKISAESFSLMLEILFDNAELGSIPEGKDRVLITDAFNISAVGAENVYIPGMNDGVFPATVTNSGMFEQKDLALLKSVGIDLPGGTERAIYDEEHLVYSALTLSEKNLFVSTYDKNLTGAIGRPSTVFESLKRMFPKRSEDPEQDFCFGKAICLEKALSKGKGIYHRALYRYFEEQSQAFQTVLERAPLVTASESISEEAAKSLYGSGPLKITQTKLETFINCPFSYNCRYVLRLKEDMRESTAENEIGTLVHAVLERAVEGCILQNRDVGSLEDREISERVDAILKEAYLEMMGEGEDNPFLQQLFRRISEGSKLLLCNIRDEFSACLFKPVFCELPFGSKTEGKIRLPAIAIEGEDSVTVKGTVDRVDCYKTEDGNAYIRIVDYKTGQKVFHPDAIKDGLNLQMLIYLKALRDCKEPTFFSGLGIKEEGKVIPAGVEYFIASRPAVQIDRFATEEEVKNTVSDSIERNGWMVNSKEVFLASGGEKRKEFLPKNKDRDVSEEELNEVLDSIDRIIGEYAQKIRSGLANATPRKKSGGFMGCTYCKMRPICRNHIYGSGEEKKE